MPSGGTPSGFDGPVDLRDVVTVALVTLGSAMSAWPLLGRLSAGYRAVVIEALASSNAPDTLCELLVEIQDKGMVVVMGTRCTERGNCVLISMMGRILLSIEWFVIMTMPGKVLFLSFWCDEAPASPE
jgi:L-asparaginase/Glu-tRNA(Gln) amidotransferase subunit D